MWSGSAGGKLRLAALIPAALLLLWLVFLRPPSMGGNTSYLIVSGHSMEPALFTHDLVVIKKLDSYQVGDILAFKVANGLVIHRAIAGNAEDGFVMQGDNRNSADPWEPTHESIIGRHIIDIPQAGRLVAALRQPVVFGMAVVAISLIGGTASRRHVLRRRRRRHMRSGESSHRGSGALGRWWPGSPRTLAALAASVALGSLGLAVAVLAFWSPTERTEYIEDVAYEHRSTFGYRAQVERSTLYPQGTLAPATTGDGTAALPQPLFTALARTMTVDYAYELDTSLPPAVTGEIAADLVIRAGDGWTRTEPLMAPRPFEGPTAQGSFTIDFAAIRSIVTQIEEETEFAPRGYTLSVEPRVTVEGTLGGRTLDSTSYQAAFDIEYNRTRITPPAELAVSEPVSIGEDVQLTNTLGILGVELSAGAWRWIGPVAAVAGLGLAAGLAAVAFLGLGQREDQRIRARYRRMLVPVASNGSTPTEQTIHVANMEDLARLAQRDGGIIFYEPGPGGYRYFVRDGQDTYDYQSIDVEESMNGAAPAPSPEGTGA